MAEREQVVIVYDGECPFCQSFVTITRLREAGAQVQLVDARQHPEQVRSLTAQGYDLDEGMVVTVGERVYHGADATHVIAMMAGAAGPLNRLALATLRSQALARLLYPAFRAIRNVTLRALGRRKIGADLDHTSRAQSS